MWRSQKSRGSWGSKERWKCWGGWKSRASRGSPRGGTWRSQESGDEEKSERLDRLERWRSRGVTFSILGRRQKNSVAEVGEVSGVASVRAGMVIEVGEVGT